MFGWLIGIIGLMVAAAIGLGGLGAVTAEKATLLGGGFAIVVIAALLAVAAGGSSTTD